jgi:hypothetical protein
MLDKEDKRTRWNWAEIKKENREKSHLTYTIEISNLRVLTLKFY